MAACLNDPPKPVFEKMYHRDGKIMLCFVSTYILFKYLFRRFSVQKVNK